MHHPHPIEFGDPKAEREVVIFHGYTGSPDEFRELGEMLAIRLAAHVTIPLLPGHEGNESALLPLSFDDFLAHARSEVQKVATLGKPFAVCGHSFGVYLAALGAFEYTPSALVATIPPFRLHVPFSIPGTAFLMRIKKFWKKQLTPQEMKDRRYKWFYPDMPGKALSLVHEGNHRLKALSKRFTCPILTINATSDPIVHPESGKELVEAIGDAHAQNKSIVLDHHRHGLFTGHFRREPEIDIAEFLAVAFADQK